MHCVYHAKINDLRSIKKSYLGHGGGRSSQMQKRARLSTATHSTIWFMSFKKKINNQNVLRKIALLFHTKKPLLLSGNLRKMFIFQFSKKTKFLRGIPIKKKILLKFFWNLIGAARLSCTTDGHRWLTWIWTDWDWFRYASRWYLWFCKCWRTMTYWRAPRFYWCMPTHLPLSHLFMQSSNK